MRGTWFYDGSWIPLELEHSEVIENVHLRIFQKQALTQSNSVPEFGTPSHSYKSTHVFLLEYIIYFKIIIICICCKLTKQWKVSYVRTYLSVS